MKMAEKPGGLPYISMVFLKLVEYWKIVIAPVSRERIQKLRKPRTVNKNDLQVTIRHVMTLLDINCFNV